MHKPARSPRKLIAVMGALSCALAGFATSASAAEFTRTLTIHHMAAVSTSRPSGPQSQSVIRIFASAAASWGSSTCRVDSADVSMDDWHIFALAMKAWKEQLSVSVVIESTQLIDTADTVCKVVAINFVS